MANPRDKVIIREATAADLPKALAVSDRAFSTVRRVYHPTGDAVARQEERKMLGTRWVAALEGKIVGTVQVADHGEHLHLIGLAIDTEFRRKGLCRLLVQGVVEYAKTLGMDTIVADTIKETGNVDLFQKLGFRVVEEHVAQWCVSEVFTELHDVKLELDVE